MTVTRHRNESQATSSSADFGSGRGAIYKILADFLGIPRSRLAEIPQALRSGRIARMVIVITGLRVARRIAKLTALAGERIFRSNTFCPEADEKLTAKEREGIGNPLFVANGDDVALPLPEETGDGLFPRLIFQTWKSKSSMPSNYAHWRESFRVSGYQYCLWDDDDNRTFIEKYYPWFLPLYDIYPQEIYRADAVRYFFLYQYGGLYADMDTQRLRSFSDLFESGDVCLGRMGNDVHFSHSIPNAIMASRPLQEFWLLVIHLMIDGVEALADPVAMAAEGPEALTGPILLKRAYDTYQSADRPAVGAMIQKIAAQLPAALQPQSKPSRLVLFEPQVWYPIDWSNVIHFRLVSELVYSQVILSQRILRWLFPGAYMVTYWTHSWKESRRS